MSETCGAHKKGNKIASDIKLVFYSSTITMMHGPINTRSIIMFTTVTGPYIKLGQFSAQHNLSWSVITGNCSTFFKMVFTSLTFYKFALLADSYTEYTESQSVKVECFPIKWDSFTISCELETCSGVIM